MESAKKLKTLGQRNIIIISFEDRKEEKKMKKNKILGLTLTGIIGLSMMTPSVFAEENIGQQSIGNNSGNNIQLNYNSVEVTNKTDYIGGENTEITLDIGYAWDDMSWTYVIENNYNSTLTTNGYEEENVSSTGTWYVGSYTQEQFNALTNEEKAAAQLPSLTMDQIAQNLLTESAQYSQEDYAKTPKLVLHNYSSNKAKFNFAIPNSEYSSYYANGVLMFLDEERKDVDALSDTFTASGDYQVSGDITLASGTTNKYGVTPMTTPNQSFSSFSTTLTLNFKNAE